MIDDNGSGDELEDNAREKNAGASASVHAEHATYPQVRRDARGRLLPGVSLNPAGRRPGSGARPTLLSIARSLVEEAGIDLDTALRSVLGSMIHQAGKGDVAAGRLVLERLTVDEDQSPRGGITIDGAGLDASVGPQPPQGPAFVDYMRELANKYREIARFGHPRSDPEHMENLAVVCEGEAGELEQGLARERAALEALLQ